MRIAHVVTYISHDGAFGGPVTVATSQAEALARRGHDVTVFAASPPSEVHDIQRSGVNVRTFPGFFLHRRLGFAGLYAPRLTASIRSQISDFDVFHIHLARDMVTLPVTRLVRSQQRPYVVQTHGMIDASRHPLARPVDAWEVRKALAGADSVLTLTSEEANDIRQVQPLATIRHINNGVTLPAAPRRDPETVKVLYLARLHRRKRPTAFVEMAHLLHAQDVEAHFVLAGPDEGEGEAVRQAAGGDKNQIVSIVGGVDPVESKRLMASASVYVLPSVGEVFPMTILEAFQTGTPVVTTDSLGIADLCRSYGAALVTDGTPSQMAAAVRQVLEDPAVASGLRQGALRLLRDKMNVDDVSKSLEDIYVAAQARYPTS